MGLQGPSKISLAETVPPQPDHDTPTERVRVTRAKLRHGTVRHHHCEHAARREDDKRPCSPVEAVVVDAHVAWGERWDVAAGHLDRVAADVVDVRALSARSLVRQKTVGVSVPELRTT